MASTRYFEDGDCYRLAGSELNLDNCCPIFVSTGMGRRFEGLEPFNLTWLQRSHSDGVEQLTGLEPFILTWLQKICISNRVITHGLKPFNLI